MGQQVLNLGYSCEHGFVPLDSEIFISAGSRYFCESLFWASQPKQAAKT
jgi:hypothetical protein